LPRFTPAYEIAVAAVAVVVVVVILHTIPEGFS
jgi:hypothetical protein